MKPIGRFVEKLDPLLCLRFKTLQGDVVPVYVRHRQRNGERGKAGRVQIRKHGFTPEPRGLFWLAGRRLGAALRCDINY